MCNLMNENAQGASKRLFKGSTMNDSSKTDKIDS